MKPSVEMVIRRNVIPYKISKVKSHLPRENCLFLQSTLCLLKINYLIIPQKLVYRESDFHGESDFPFNIKEQKFCACQRQGNLSSFPVSPTHKPTDCSLYCGHIHSPNCATQNAANFLTFNCHFAKKQF